MLCERKSLQLVLALLSEKRLVIYAERMAAAVAGCDSEVGSSILNDLEEVARPYPSCQEAPTKAALQCCKHQNMGQLELGRLRYTKEKRR